MGGNRSAGSASADTPLEAPLGGSTPLLFAARSGDVESARQLIAAGASVNDAQADGNTVLIVAAHSVHGTLARLLMEHGADVKAAPLSTALHAAILRGTLRDRSLVNPDLGAGVALIKALVARGPT
jgi:ankyrin repeat protein